VVQTRRLDPCWETLYALTISMGGTIGQGVTLLLSSVALPHPRVLFCCKTLLYQNLNQNYNILHPYHLIYGVYVCTCIFLLRQESFDMILVNNLSYQMGV
jgi:hypothetical protein